MKKFSSFLVIISLLINSSCTTSTLWDRDAKYYDEVIESYLSNEDGSILVFLGQKYHYILNNNDSAVLIAKMLQRENGPKMTVNITNFLADGNKVNATLNLDSDRATLSKEDKIFLQQMGFNQNYTKKIKLSGTRYLPRKNVNYQHSSLSNSYKIQVKEKEEDSLVDKAAKITFTPITVTIDGALIILISGAVVVTLLANDIVLHQPPETRIETQEKILSILALLAIIPAYVVKLTKEQFGKDEEKNLSASTVPLEGAQ